MSIMDGARRRDEPITVVVPLADLLPAFRDSIEQARTSDGWDEAQLLRAIQREFDFLAPHTSARIDEVSTDSGNQEVLILAFSPPETRDLVRLERAFAKATRRAERGDAKGAIPELERVVDEAPEVAKYRRALGQAYLVAGDSERAEDELLRSLALDPRNGDALTLLGNLYMQAGRPDRALPLYERSAEIETNVYAVTNAGAALAKLGRIDEAIATFRRATDIDAGYPNAWYAIGLALSQKQELRLIPEAIAALERAITAQGHSAERAAIEQQSRRLLMSLSRLNANETARGDGDAVLARALEEPLPGNDLPVRVEGGAVSGALAKIEFGWVHNRPYHRVITAGEPNAARLHMVLHELEHLRLTSLARSTGTNRWFATGSVEEATARRAISADVQRIAKRGAGEAQARTFAEYASHGLLSQLYNFPVDFLIEDRLLARYPVLREVVFQAIVAQLDTSRRILQDKSIAAMTPRVVFRANAAMNGAFAYWVDARFPGRTDFAAEFGRSETGPLSRSLFAQWSKAQETWTPGAELTWVDQWARSLGLRDWYTWVDDSSGRDEAADRTDIVEP